MRRGLFCNICYFCLINSILMIQRIQTLYLAGSMIACILLFFLPVARFFNEPQGTYLFFVAGVRYLEDPTSLLYFWQTFPLALLTGLSLILVVAAIFLYKNRKLQVLMVNIAFLLHVALIMLIYFYYIGHFQHLFKVATPSYLPGVFVPVVSLFLLVLASRAIRKDEALVKAADRLR